MTDRYPAFVDYETFWDVGYSLRQQKVSTTDYVHDDRFAIHGASVAFNKDDPKWLIGDDLRRWVELAQSSGCLFVGHHTLFDGYVTTHSGYEFPDYFCTMGLIEALFQGAIGRGLDEAMKTLLGWEQGKTDILDRTKGKYWHELTKQEQEDMAFYANGDLRATQELFWKYGPCLPAEEWEIMSCILKMFCHPRLEFDTPLLTNALQAAHDDRDSRIENAMKYFGCTEEDLRKQKFLEMLESCDIPVPMKPSPSKGPEHPIPALAKTDQGFQDLLEHDDPRVKALAEGRLAVKSTQGITRAQRFIDLDKAIGKLPVAYNYYRAHTGRLSGANKINLANLKAKSDLRKSIVAPKGYRIGVADSGQIECRKVNYLAGNEYMLELFRKKEDPYNAMASDIFGREIDRNNVKDDFMPGFIGKTAVLGLGFQMGGPKFKWTVEVNAKTRLDMDYHMSLDEAYRVVDIYRTKNWPVPKLWEACERMLFAMSGNGNSYEFEFADDCLRIDTENNKIWFPNGTCLFFPCLSYDDGNFTYVTRLGKKYVNRYLYGGKLTENIVQKAARDIVAWQMLKIAERYKIVLHTYDENAFLIPEKEADEGMEWALEIMRTPPPWCKNIPLEADGGHAREYSK